MKVLFATTNPAKIKNYKEELNKNGIELITIKDLDFDIEINENGKNALENAFIKAKTYYDATGIVSIGMDNNLFIEGLPEEKQPGTHVRRVNGKRLTDEEMIERMNFVINKYKTAQNLIIVAHARLICTYLKSIGIEKNNLDYCEVVEVEI